MADMALPYLAAAAAFSVPNACYNEAAIALFPESLVFCHYDQTAACDTAATELPNFTALTPAQRATFGVTATAGNCTRVGAFHGLIRQAPCDQAYTDANINLITYLMDKITSDVRGACGSGTCVPESGSAPTYSQRYSECVYAPATTASPPPADGFDWDIGVAAGAVVAVAVAWLVYTWAAGRAAGPGAPAHAAKAGPALSYGPGPAKHAPGGAHQKD